MKGVMDLKRKIVFCFSFYKMTSSIRLVYFYNITYFLFYYHTSFCYMKVFFNFPRNQTNETLYDERTQQKETPKRGKKSTNKIYQDFLRHVSGTRHVSRKSCLKRRHFYEASRPWGHSAEIIELLYKSII